MRHHYLCDKVMHKQICVFWCSGKDNEGDYYTKHWSVTYHRNIRPRYIQDTLTHTLNMLTHTARVY